MDQVGTNRKDRIYNNRRDKVATKCPDLPHRIPRDGAFIAVDSKGKLIAFLFPKAIQYAFGHEQWDVKDRIKTHTVHLYRHIKVLKSG